MSDANLRAENERLQKANEQTSGNTSEMVRILLAEAVAARQANEQKR